MRKLLCLTAAAVLALSAVALASDKYLFTLVSTNPTADTSNTTTETLVAGVPIAVQCDAAAYIRASSDGTAATTNDVKVAADQLYDVDFHSSENRLSALAVSGTANCKVYSVRK